MPAGEDDVRSAELHDVRSAELQLGGDVVSRLRPPAVLVLLALAAGCGARFYSPPSGAGVPAPDGSSALADATKDCRGIKTLQAAMRLSGRRLPSLNVMTGVTADGKLLLLVGATAAPDLWLAGTADAAILLLRDGNRVVRAHAADIVDALIDAPLGPEQLLAILSGCAARDLTLTGAIAYDRTRRITTPDGDLFVEQIGGAWRIVAAIVGAVRVDYRPIIDRFPTRISVRTKLADGREVPFRLDIQEALVDRPIEEKHFQLEVPAGAEPMTLDELRQMFSRR